MFKIIFVFSVALAVASSSLPLSWEYNKIVTLPSGRKAVQIGFQTGGSVKFTREGDTWQCCVDSCPGYDFRWVSATFKPLDTRPSPRENFAMAVLSTSTNKALLFGGLNDDEILGDTWIYNNKNGKTCKELCNSYGPETTYNTASWTKLSCRNPPEKRMFHQMVSLGKESSILFGGMNGTNFFNDTWSFSEDNNWRQLFPTISSGSVESVESVGSVGPVARIQHAMSAPNFDQVMLFAGADQDGNVLDDLWFFNQTVGSEGQWKRIDKVNNKSNNPNWPEGRRDHGLTWINGAVLLFGGSNQKGNLKGDTWLFQISTGNIPVMKWFEVETKTTSSASALDSLRQRWGMALSSLPGGSHAILSGGTDQYNEEASSSLIFTPSATNHHNVADKSKYSGTWKRVLNQTGRLDTKPHFNHAIGELGEGKAVLFGGATSSNVYYPGTWVFDGTKSSFNHDGTSPWSRLIQGVTPPMREDHTLTGIDATHAILFAGITGKVPRNDTWLFTLDPDCHDTGFGSSCGKWEEIVFPFDAPIPEARYFHAAAKIQSTGTIIMWGGFSGINMWGSSLWYFTTPSSPEPRVYDKPYTIGFLDDTWVHKCVFTTPHLPSSCSWRKITMLHRDGSKTSPSKRCMHAMTSFGDAVIMHGGFDGGDVLGDTWTFVLNDSESSGTWSQLDKIVDLVRPTPRILHRIQWMGGQKMLLFGGQENLLETDENFPIDTWMFYRKKSAQECIGPLSKCFTWIKLSGASGPDPRSRHVMFSGSWSSIDETKSPMFTILLYGGQIQQFQNSRPHLTTGNDLWKFHIGCPSGTYSGNIEEGSGCISCPTGKYNPKVTILTNACEECPVGTTTPPGWTDVATKRSCSLCDLTKLQKNRGDCTIDQSGEIYTQKWVCYGSWGQSCEHSCLCNPSHSLCDEGTNGTGLCTCKPNYYGIICNEPCQCKNGGCHDMAQGDGSCTCDFMFLLSSDCSIPVMGFIVIFLAAVAVATGILVTRKMLKHRFNQEIEETEALHVNQYQLLEQELGEVKEESDLRVKQLSEAWLINENDLEWEKRLAAGSFGEVWKGKWALLPNQPVALKKIFVTAQNIDSIMKNGAFGDQEIAVLMQTSRHARIVMFFGAGQLSEAVGGNIFVVSEFVSGGDLFTKLSNKKKLTWSDRMFILRDIAEGMEFIHSKEMIHRGTIFYFDI